MSPRHAVAWAMVLVACLHLLTTAGTYMTTDQAEMLFTARRLLSHHTLDLADAAGAPPRELAWLKTRPDRPPRTRHLPLTALTLAPMIGLERTLGWEHPGDIGPISRLQGHLFVWLGLLLLALAVRESGASAGAQAAAAVFTGTSWPIWRTSIAIGPEAILVFWVALYLWALAQWRDHPHLSLALRAVTLLMLPWTHATGPLVAGGLLAGDLVLRALSSRPVPAARVLVLRSAHGGGIFGAEAPGSQGATRAHIGDMQPRSNAASRDASASIYPHHGRISALVLLAAAVAGVGSMLVIWNWAYHGDWWRGGYSLYYSADSFFAIEAIPRGLVSNAAVAVRVGPAILAAIAWAALSRRLERRDLAVPLTLTLILLAMLLTMRSVEPAERRMVPAWLAWGATLGLCWDRLPLRPPIPQLLAASGALASFKCFMDAAGRYYPGPAGLFYPNVLWVRWALEGRAWPAAAVVAAIGAATCVAAARTWRTLGCHTPTER